MLSGHRWRPRLGVRSRGSFAFPHQGVVVVHEQPRVFLDDRLGNTLGHLDDGLVVALLPALLESCTKSLRTDDFDLPSRFMILLELLQQCSMANLLKIALLFRVGDTPSPIRFLYTVLLKDGLQLQRLLMLLPHTLSLSHEDWLKRLLRDRFLRQPPTNPLDRTLLITDEELQLLDPADFEPLPVIFDNLIRQEIHPISLGKSLAESEAKLSRREWDGVATLNMECDHTIVQNITLSFDDGFSLTILRDEDRYLLQMIPNELPGRVLATNNYLEALLQLLARAIGRYHEILLDGCARDLAI